MSTIKLFTRYLRKYWPLFLLCVGMVVGLNYIRSLVPKLASEFVYIIDTSSTESELPTYIANLYNLLPKTGGVVSTKDKLLLTAIIIITLTTVRDVINIISDVNIFRISEVVGCQAQIDYFKKVQNLPYTYLNHAETGDLIQRSTQDISRFKNFITGSFMDLFNNLCKLIIYTICMFLINAEFTMYVVIFLPIYFISSYIYFKKQSDDFTKLEEKEGAMTNVLQENLTGIRVVKSFANEQYEINKFNNAINEYTGTWRRTTLRMSKFWGISDILTYAQLLLVFVLSVIFITRENNPISFSQVVVMFLYTEQIAWPCRGLGRELAELGKTNICCKRIIEVLDKEDEYKEEQNQTPEILGNIDFKDVSFKFSDSNIPTLEHVNLSIKAGETIAIIGKTGSGKSTFVHMLNRLVDPTSGQLLLDGNDILTMDKKWVRENVGIILQEPFLFSRTIGENINISLSHDDINKARELAKEAHVDKDIEGFDLKYDTVVGERGVTLSGGQKQRIAIARMLAKRHAILVFDDSLSAVDTETDLHIRKSLKEQEGKCTMIIITHRIITAKDADKIIVFEDGKISHIGTHDELIKVPGLYQTIWNIQTYFNDLPEEGGELAHV